MHFESNQCSFQKVENTRVRLALSQTKPCHAWSSPHVTERSPENISRWSNWDCRVKATSKLKIEFTRRANTWVSRQRHFLGTKQIYLGSNPSRIGGSGPYGLTSEDIPISHEVTRREYLLDIERNRYFKPIICPIKMFDHDDHCVFLGEVPKVTCQPSTRALPEHAFGATLPICIGALTPFLTSAWLACKLPNALWTASTLLASPMACPWGKLRLSKAIDKARGSFAFWPRKAWEQPVARFAFDTQAGEAQEWHPNTDGVPR